MKRRRAFEHPCPLSSNDDVPPTTDEFAHADEKTRQRVIALIDELVRVNSTANRRSPDVSKAHPSLFDFVLVLV